MSEPYDLDEEPRGTVLIDATCERCGGSFRAEARPDTVAGDGYQGPPTQLERYCKACGMLGFDPPESPCCEVRLQGLPDGELACISCGTAFGVESVRTYAFGMECERIVREARATVGTIAPWIVSRLFKSARELGVIR